MSPTSSDLFVEGIGDVLRQAAYGNFGRILVYRAVPELLGQRALPRECEGATASSAGWDPRRGSVQLQPGPAPADFMGPNPAPTPPPAAAPALT